MFKSIMVALDGTDAGENAFITAMDLAKRCDSQLSVVCVFPLLEGELFGDYFDTLKAPAERTLQKAEEAAKSRSMEIGTILRQGEAYEEIIKAAEDEKAELIIMGRRGYTRLERMLMGSVTSRVVGHSSCSVFIVPRGMKLNAGPVLVASDGSDYSMAAISKAIGYAKTFHKKLIAVTVVDTNNEFMALSPSLEEQLERQAVNIMDDIKTKASAAGLEVEGIVHDGNASSVIVDEAKRVGVGLIFLGSHGRKGLPRLLMGSVAERVVGHAPCPVFIAKA